MKKAALSLHEIRSIAVSSQLLAPESRIPPGKTGTLSVIRSLGYIQIDTISVVERAHHHTLWSRVPGYHPGILDEMLNVDRSVFEYWGHAASYLPMEDYRFYLPLMQSKRMKQAGWVSDWIKSNGKTIREVESRIRSEGPLSSSDFQAPEGSKRGPWWDWKATKMALEILFWQGVLMIHSRRNFQRIYDLTERVLPAHVDTRIPTREELGRFCILRCLNAHGIANQKEIRNHMPVASAETIHQMIPEMVDDGQIIPVTSNSGSDRLDYVLPETLEGLKQREPIGACHILSPFDNFLIMRDRVRRLFQFEYTLECYLPVSKRRYGYFTLPIFWRNEFRGRMDAKADRKTKTLVVKSIAWEPGFRPNAEFEADFSRRMSEFSHFNQCHRISMN